MTKVFDDPNWTFDYFGDEVSLGGIETAGIRRSIPMYQTYSEIHDSKVVVKDNYVVKVP